jgi:anti-sigma factor RsiW
MTCNEAQELITGFIDRELTDGEQALLEAHLQGCADCRLALASEQKLKQDVRAAGGRLKAPPRLRERIISDPGMPSRRSPAFAGWRNYGRRLTLRQAAASAAVAVAIIVLPLVYFLSHSWPRAGAVLLESSEAFLDDKVPLIRAASEAQLVEQLVAATGGRFKPMGYDFTSLGMRPVAGAVREISGRKVLIAVYRGAQGALLCYTLVGSEHDAPEHAAKFVDEHKGMTFFAFSRGAVNAVLHREGDLICILAAEMPMADLLALTRSKARAH